jgi:hypothetical protein
LVAVVSAFQRGAGDQSLERVANRERALHGIGRPTAHVFDPKDPLGAGWTGKRLERHRGGGRRQGERAARGPGPPEVGGRPRGNGDPWRRQAEAAKPIDLAAAGYRE